MSDLTETELRRLDLTLLLIFLGLLRHRKARLVADDLGMTQSAISQALRRLRDIFSDDLFLRRPHGLEPTATALALEAPINGVVETLRSALKEARAFDPAQAQGIVRIAALDALQAVLITALSARLWAEAPGLRLSVLPLGREDAVLALHEGRADIALGLMPKADDRLSQDVLYEETYLVAGTPAALPNAPDLTLDWYCAANHILVSPVGDLNGIVDLALTSLGRSRRVVLALPAFLPALAAASQSGLLATMPARVARTFAPGFGLRTATPPFPIRSFEVSAYWHRRNDANPQTVWLRQQIGALI